jgi:hypothetical protein
MASLRRLLRDRTRGGGLADIAVPLAVLAGFAGVLLALASARLRRRLTA